MLVVTSICCTVKLLTFKRYEYIDWNRHFEIGPSLHMGNGLRYREPINNVLHGFCKTIALCLPQVKLVAALAALLVEHISAQIPFS